MARARWTTSTTTGSSSTPSWPTATTCEIGDTIHLLLIGGQELDLTVQGITDDEQVLGYFTITRDTYMASVPEPLDAFVYGSIDEGADLDAVIADIEPIVEDVPDLIVEDREGFIGTFADQIAFFVNFITIMLLLSIIIALIGVANTLSLSISERVRELGLLRAVGMNKTQLKLSIRWEAVIMSLLGTAIGIFLALVMGRAMLKALEPSGLLGAVPGPDRLAGPAADRRARSSAPSWPSSRLVGPPSSRSWMPSPASSTAPGIVNTCSASLRSWRSRRSRHIARRSLGSRRCSPSQTSAFDRTLTVRGAGSSGAAACRGTGAATGEGAVEGRVLDGEQRRLPSDRLAMCLDLRERHDRRLAEQVFVCQALLVGDGVEDRQLGGPTSREDGRDRADDRAPEQQHDERVERDPEHREPGRLERLQHRPADHEGQEDADAGAEHAT